MQDNIPKIQLMCTYRIIAPNHLHAFVFLQWNGQWPHRVPGESARKHQRNTDSHPAKARNNVAGRHSLYRLSSSSKLNKTAPSQIPKKIATVINNAFPSICSFELNLFHFFKIYYNFLKSIIHFYLYVHCLNQCNELFVILHSKYFFFQKSLLMHNVYS